jgi:hypothetical protein
MASGKAQNARETRQYPIIQPDNLFAAFIVIPYQAGQTAKTISQKFRRIGG